MGRPVSAKLIRLNGAGRLELNSKKLRAQERRCGRTQTLRCENHWCTRGGKVDDGTTALTVFGAESRVVDLKFLDALWPAGNYRAKGQVVRWIPLTR